MSQKVDKNTAVKNSIWKLLESFLSKGISMVVSIILARILMPEDYGVIALTTVFINLTDILIQAGFSTALISKETVNEDDYSTVLGISIISAIILYCILFVCSPFIAEVYDTPVLVPVLRVISLALFLQAFAAVRTAVVSRNMQFKVLFFCTLISNFVSGIMGIAAAFCGLGVWALVLQQLSQQFLLTVTLFITVKMKIKFRISRQSVREIAPFSFKVLTAALLSFAGDSLYSVAIGKFYSLKDLGYYDKGGQFPRQFSLYTFSAVSNVFLPVFASYKEDYPRLNEIFRRVVNVSCYIIFPLMAGICVAAKPFISLLLTDKWLPCVEILRWFCLYYAATPILLANVQLHFAIGKGNTRIKTETMRIILMVVMFIIFITVKASIVIIAAGLSVIQVIISAVITVETQRATGYIIRNSVTDALPTIASVIIMCIGIYAVSLTGIYNNFILFVLEVIVGASIYLLSSVILRNRALQEVLDMMKLLISKKGKKV